MQALLLRASSISSRSSSSGQEAAVSSGGDGQGSHCDALLLPERSRRDAG